MYKSQTVAVILTERDPVKYSAIIERANNLGYHDFLFDSVEGHPEYAEDICPKMRLYQDLDCFPELQDVKQRMIDGEFDDEFDDTAKEKVKTNLLKTNSPDSLFIAMRLPIPTKEERDAYRLH